MEEPISTPPKKKRSLLKKVAIGFGGLFLLLVVIGAVTPQPQNTSNKVQSTQPQHSVTTKNETVTESIPFTNQDQNDPNLLAGQTKISQAGVNGTKQITYRVTYTDGTQTNKEKINEIVSQQAVAQITLHGTKVVTANPSSGLSNNNTYTNSDGNQVHSPAYSNGGVPAGATAKCNDGTYSFSQHRQGTCSYHGGVAQWL